MKYYLAPIEGVTGFIYRNAYAKFFNHIDKYFTPFIVTNQGTSLKNKELRDVFPENNQGLHVVPQILTNNSEGFISVSKKLKQLGYAEINLNLGCPSGTVVSKNRGSGFLAKREELDRFLEEIFKIEDMKISIKTRIGKDHPEEFYELIKIYNKYPLEELIIHPRTRQDFYGNQPNLEVFKDALLLSTNPVCYNGDIFTVGDHNRLVETFPDVDTMMLGRGVLANPGLMKEIRNNTLMEKEVLREFIDEVLYQYVELFQEERNALYRMKELWSYMAYIFSDSKKYAKKIKKAQSVKEYNEAVSSLFEEQEIIKGAGLFSHSY
ncbi:tRNA dihydrouridine synthase [Alkaliphilus oremlandii]|uniref:tRNA-dihydrouridine synthase n=1 Tax=Alkaliphilus oremlandii (strain OhILAs) TaxID=350688 RepID=A8MFZ3_ALKOO|nr:tRNA-dihydrouridine synthase family protein [Alkaliphilus oremlandii]ABW18531.1 dihydrouridine synthase DuS [Alkaliphilus oremlandii OhILAs]